MNIRTNLIEEVDYLDDSGDEPKILPIRMEIGESGIRVDLSTENHPKIGKPFYDCSSVYIEFRNHIISVTTYREVSCDGDVMELHEFK
tara:strand:+ start:986 stop:1249 length:264 start_codon:yes stop_codon:yes gene_type:complete